MISNFVNKLSKEELAMHNLLDEHMYKLVHNIIGQPKARCTICGKTTSPDVLRQDVPGTFTTSSSVGPSTSPCLSPSISPSISLSPSAAPEEDN